MRTRWMLTFNAFGFKIQCPGFASEPLSGSINPNVHGLDFIPLWEVHVLLFHSFTQAGTGGRGHLLFPTITRLRRKIGKTVRCQSWDYGNLDTWHMIWMGSARPPPPKKKKKELLIKNNQKQLKWLSFHKAQWILTHWRFNKDTFPPLPPSLPPPPSLTKGNATYHRVWVTIKTIFDEVAISQRKGSWKHNTTYQSKWLRT